MKLTKYCWENRRKKIPQKEFSEIQKNVFKKTLFSYFFWSEQTDSTSSENQQQNRNKLSGATIQLAPHEFFALHCYFEEKRSQWASTKGKLEILCMHSFLALSFPDCGAVLCIIKQQTLTFSKCCPFSKFSASTETFDSRHLLILSLLHLLADGVDGIFCMSPYFFQSFLLSICYSRFSLHSFWPHWNVHA